MVDIGDEQISLHLQHTPSNATYALTTSAKNILKVIGNFLNDKVITDVLVTGDFTMLSDESTDEGESLWMSVYVRFVDAQTHKPVEHFLGMVQLTTSKKAANLHDVMGLLASKGLDNTLIRFCGMDGTNAMSGERKGLQHRICHTSPHSIYGNCNNHWLALCLKHMIPRYHTLVELD